MKFGEKMLIDLESWMVRQKGLLLALRNSIKHTVGLHFGFAIILATAFSFMAYESSGDRRRLACSIFLALSAFGIGASIGFLFGLPKVAQGKTDGGSQSYQLFVNNNLNFISDWLTKLLIGVGIAEFYSATSTIDQIACLFSGEFGSVKEHQLYALSIIYMFLALGLLFGYIFTRLFLTEAFAVADRDVMEKQFAERVDDIRASIDLHRRIELFVDRAQYHRAMGGKDRADRAQILVETALNLKPNSEAALLKEAVLLGKAREWDQAVEVMDRLLGYKSDSAVGYLNRGFYLLMTHYSRHRSRGFLSRKPHKETINQKPLSHDVLDRILSDWTKAFELLPELGEFAARDYRLKAIREKEPKINELLESVKHHK